MFKYYEKATNKFVLPDALDTNAISIMTVLSRTVLGNKHLMILIILNATCKDYFFYVQLYF